jgi:hypothetical protein
MGGKAKLLDTKALEQIYSTAASFKRNSEDITKDVRFKLNQLTDPAFLDRMRGEHGEACIEAIHNGASDLEELLELIGSTSNFIDSKFTEAVRLELNNSNQDRKGANKLNNRLNLKR